MKARPVELGAELPYVGREMPIEVGGRDFRDARPFYRPQQRCSGVVALQAVAFEPEHAGRLGCNLCAVDDRTRSEHDARAASGPRRAASADALTLASEAP